VTASTALPRGFWWALAALTAASLALRLAWLPSQPLIPDDVSVGQTALNFSAAGWPGPTMWNHPHLRDLLVAGALRLLGDGAVSLKLWSAVLGALSVPAAAALVLVAGGGPVAALVAGAVVGADPLHLDFSRQAINDVYLACLSPAAVAAAWKYRADRRPGWLLAAGALLGLGLASKHAIAFPALVVAVALLVETLRTPARPPERLAELAFGVACLAVLPLTLYLATFYPWFLRGSDLAEWLRFQVTSAQETATHVGYPGTKLPDYFNELVGAWRWFLQPIWYVDDTMVGSVEQGSLQWTLIAGIGNPLTWLLVWPAALHAAWRWARRGDRTAGLLLSLFLAAYLPFAVARRPIWSNSALAVLPFAAALLGLGAARVRDRWPGLFTGWAAAALLTAALLWLPAAGFTSGPSSWVVERLVPEAALTPRAELVAPGHPGAAAAPEAP
jgi:dolichyl-phosphate-mannose-protein mannosyltransferase